MGNRESVFNGISGSGIVFRIVDFLIYNRLELWVLSRINGQTAAVKQVMGLGVCITKLVLHCLFDLLHQFIREIAVWGGGFLGGGVYILDSGIDIVGQSLILLFLCNVSLVKHVLENYLLLVRIGLLSCDRVKL